MNTTGHTTSSSYCILSFDCLAHISITVCSVKSPEVMCAMRQNIVTCDVSSTPQRIVPHNSNRCMLTSIVQNAAGWSRTLWYFWNTAGSIPHSTSFSCILHVDKIVGTLKEIKTHNGQWGGLKLTKVIINKFLKNWKLTRKNLIMTMLLSCGSAESLKKKEPTGQKWWDS